MATTVDRLTDFRQPDAQMIQPFTVAAATVIRQGVMVGINTATGFLVELTDVAARVAVGVSMEPHTALDPQEDIKVATDGAFDFNATSILQTHVGLPMYSVDNDTFDNTSAQLICVGKLVKFVTTTRGWIDIGVAAQLSLAGTLVTFADTGAYIHEPALAAVAMSPAVIEFHEEFDDHVCETGAGTNAVSPGVNREHFAACIDADGRGLAHLVQAIAGGIVAMTVVRYSNQVAGYVNAIPEVEPATNTTGTRPAHLYCPTAILAGVYGWAFKYYCQVNSGLDTSMGAAVGDPVWRGVAGALTLAQPTGANRAQVIGRVLTLAANGEVQIDFDDWNLPPHNHNSEACGGQLGAWIHHYQDAALNAGGGATVLVAPLWEVPYNISITRCYASLDTAAGGAATLALTVNGNALVTFQPADVQQEAEALAIAIAANTDIIFSTNQTAGGIAADLHVSIYYVAA